MMKGVAEIVVVIGVLITGIQLIDMVFAYSLVEMLTHPSFGEIFIIFVVSCLALWVVIKQEPDDFL